MPLLDLGQATGWDWHEVALGPGELPEHDEACGGGVGVLDGGQLVPSHLERRTALVRHVSNRPPSLTRDEPQGGGRHEVALGPEERPEHDEACGGGVVVLNGGQLAPSHLERRRRASAMRS